MHDHFIAGYVHDFYDCTTFDEPAFCNDVDGPFAQLGTARRPQWRQCLAELTK
jgi:hypothetical protein